MKWIKTEGIELGRLMRTYTRGDYTIRGYATDQGWRYVAHHAGVRIEGQPLSLTQSFRQAKAVCGVHAQKVTA